MVGPAYFATCGECVQCGRGRPEFCENASPGPSVTEAADTARAVGDDAGVDPCLGGTTTPGRRRSGFDEPDRMLAKQRAGIDFFTTQVVFDPRPAIELLRDYEAACRDASVDPARPTRTSRTNRDAVGASPLRRHRTAARDE